MFIRFIITIKRNSSSKSILTFFGFKLKMTNKNTHKKDISKLHPDTNNNIHMFIQSIENADR